MFNQSWHKIIVLTVLPFVVTTIAELLFYPSFTIFNKASCQTQGTPDTTAEEPLPTLRFPFEDNGNFILEPDRDSSLLYLRDPDNISSDIEYDPETNQYRFSSKVGNLEYRNPSYMTFDEYQEYDLDQVIKKYWNERAATAVGPGKDGIIPSIYIGGEVFDRIFGSNTIDIRPNGSAELTFGILANSRDDPTLNVKQRRTVNFDFEENIQMNVTAKIGDKISFNVNFNTEAIFQFENKLKLAYEGEEDDIIKLIEAGNVSLPLNTTLIKGTQSLFGIKTKLQFGRTTVTALFSEQESETKNLTVQGGDQLNEFYLKATDYEENKHFFISQLFRDSYDQALSQLPIISSNINITKIEVWITNIGPAVEQNRNVVALQDLGEFNEIYSPYVSPLPGGQYSSNYSNNLLSQMNLASIKNINNVTNYMNGDPLGIGQTGYMVAGIDYEKIENARKLQPNEFTFNSKLGFISLYTTLNSDQALAVAFQYNVIGIDSVFQVGQFSDESVNTTDCLVVKLLKSTSLNTRIPIWDLMMKNVYSIGAYRISREGFIFNILYSGNTNGVPTGYFTVGPDNVKGVPLLEVLNLDNLDNQLNPPADGVFDFLDNAQTQGGTVNSQNGRIYFTVVEPFGQYLRDQFGPEYEDLANIYVFDTLYRATKTIAEQQTEKNKFLLEGFYSSSSGAEIDLNAFNIPRGSVKVTAGGRVLMENTDYTVDYTLGRVRIINEGVLNSGLPINISTENQASFNVQQKRLMGVNFDHQFNKDFRFGGTLMNLHERPLTQKVDYGNDPISNTIWGIDVSYQKESRFITKMVDMLPGIDTKAPSRVNIEGEFAQFIPGHAKAISQAGIVYIDDFEGAESTIDLRNPSNWYLASTPQGQQDLFPEGASLTRSYGYNRAKLSWYVIDPLFYDKNSNLRPPNVSKDEISKNTTREVFENEVFPNKSFPNGIPTNIPVFNVAFYPQERGPYNYDVNPTQVSRGVNADGLLLDPETRWGGIMRKIESTDFESNNVEYIEFWLMDPFNQDANQDNPGKLYINLGDISEDILKDSRKSFENGLPTSEVVENVDTTIWGRVSTLQNLVESFDNAEAARPFQDVGYDGLSSNDERSFFDDPFLQELEQSFGIISQAYNEALEDPSTDNYHYFRGSDYDADPQYSSLLERYKGYNGADGNSPTDAQNPETYPTAASTIPNVEDLNRDNTLSEAERYFQYVIELDPNKMNIGENYITDIQYAGGIYLPNAEIGEVKWYQFKVPIRKPDRVVGSIDNFKSIRFMRMFVREFSQPVVLRFATLEVVRGEWRRYTGDLLAPGEYIPDDIQALTTFDIATVNYEENGRRSPIPYVIPPGIEQETFLGTTTYIQLNEQSMSLKVCDLVDGDSRAVYKTTEFDFRQYKNLELYIHAEKVKEEDIMNYGDLTAFVRVGADFTENYYEYEVPLTFTEWGTSIPEEIWPGENIMRIDLSKLVQAKLNRNERARDAGQPVSILTPYYELDGNNTITVLGEPTISDVMAIMIGIRNPKKYTINDTDDGQPKCAEIWVNELRLTDFNDQSGWAAVGRINTTLADLGTVVFAASHSTPDFGQLEMKINDTEREATTQLDFATDLNLGKFFPEQAGVRIPMHFDYSQIDKQPQYNPMSPDIKLKDDLATYDNKYQQDSVKAKVEDYTQRRNLNFVNVRKDRVGSKKKPMPYDIANFNVSYAYTNIYHRSIDLEYDNKTNHQGGLGYNYSISPKNVKPFQNVGFLNNKALKLVGDFNFYYLPKSFSFRTDMSRDYNERKMRNKSIGEIIIRPTFTKQWNWNRNFDLKFDLTTGLTLLYRAVASAYINEPPGSKDPNSPYYDQEAYDSINIRKEFFSGGTMRNFSQQLEINYKIPIDKIPGLDWITAQYSYKSNYLWTASPSSIQARLGNTIENSQDNQLNGNLDFTRLYNKIPYLSQLNKKQSSQSQRPAPRPKAEVPEEKEQDTTKKINWGKIALDGTLKILTMVKRGSFSYTESKGTSLPGFIPEPSFIGVDWSKGAPGFAFVFGGQEDIRAEAGSNGWITKDSLLNNPYANKFTTNFNAKATLEPFTGFRIEITADRIYAKNHQEFYRYSDSTMQFESYTATDMGSFSISTITWGTAFGVNYKGTESDVWERMKDYRSVISERLASQNPNSTGTVYDTATGREWAIGYGPLSQDVLVPSFLAAYTNNSVTSQPLSYFPRIPLPNWRLTWEGLNKIGNWKNVLQAATISHSYKSTFIVSNFRTNLYFNDFGTGNPAALYEELNSFYPNLDLTTFNITEQFAPLIGIDMTWVNNLQTRVEYKKSRNMTFSMANKQMTDMSSDEIVVGLGYRIKDLSFTISSMGGSGRKTNITSDLDIKVDLSVRNNRTVLRRLDTNQDQISTGQQVVSINTTIDYMLSKSLNLSLFFDKVINNPYVSNQYRNSTTRGGIKLRFSLSQ